MKLLLPAVLSGALLLLLGWALGWARCRAVAETYDDVQFVS